MTSLKSIYNIIIEKKSNLDECNYIEKLRGMIKRQGSMFPRSSDYDHRKVFDDKNVSKLQTYFDTELLQILTQITRGRTSKEDSAIDENKKT